MDNECEMCGTYDHTGTWHGICFECVGNLKKQLDAANARVDRLEKAMEKITRTFGSAAAISIAEAALAEKVNEDV